MIRLVMLRARVVLSLVNDLARRKRYFING